MRAAHRPHIVLPSQLAQGVVAAYDFNLGIGPNVPDVSGNGNNGQWQGTLGSQWGNDGYKPVGVLNGTNNAVLIPDSPSLRPAALSMAVGVNLSTSGATDGIILSKGQTNNSGSFASYSMFFHNSNSIFCRLNIGGTRVSVGTGALSLIGARHHCVMTYDGIACKIYIDTVLRASTAVSGSITYAALPLTLGADNNAPLADLLNGSLEYGYLWSRALTPDDVQTHFALGQGKAYPFI